MRQVILLKAQFVVHEGIPSELKVGIFREPKSYAALIRLSNSSASIKSDKQKDFRGFAINEATTPIEDAAVEWTAANRPFIKLATIQIPIQSTNNAARNDLVETMSFSPAHALAVHRPLGGLTLIGAAPNAADRSGGVAIAPRGSNAITPMLHEISA